MIGISKDIFRWSSRLKALPPYLFVEIDRAKRDAARGGRNIIDFGVGDPDLPTPPFIIQALLRALKDKTTHRYPLDKGRAGFRRAIARWYLKRFGVHLDPETEVLPLIGSKDGITHIPLAFIDRGDRVWVPDPGYPAYRSGVVFAGGIPVALALHPQNDFLPDWKALSKRVPRRLRMIYLNYPHNPTSAVATRSTFREAVLFAQRRGVIVCHDNAYSEIYYEGERPMSFLETPGAREVGVEFHSLSKTFNMTGWRVGFVVGNKKAVAALSKVKSNIDSGVFSAIQAAGEKALSRHARFTSAINAVYERRRNLLVRGLRKLGSALSPPKATFYVWCRVPQGAGSSTGFSRYLLKEAGIMVTPGNGFGHYGEGFVRMALTVPEAEIREALKRLEGKMLWHEW